MTAEAGTAWDRALRALALLAVDPTGLKGLTLRARAGPVRQAFEEALARLPGPARRIHVDLSDTQLFGGPDIAATLAEGRLVTERGIAERPARLVLPMAERTPPALAARLAQLLDAERGHGLVLLDEGTDEDEAAPAALRDRLAFDVDLGTTRWNAARILLPAPADLDAARARLAAIEMPEATLPTLAALAARFGIDSLRAPLLALRAARAAAALAGRSAVSDADIREAAELVYPARATRTPQEDPPPADPDDAPEETAPPETAEDTDGPDAPGDIPDEMLVDAVAALLPRGLLDQMAERAGFRAPAGGAGAGAPRKGNRRGRPLPARPGHADGRARIDVVATLRAAAPWQPLRRAQRRPGQRVVVHPSDIRLHRYEDRSDRLLIFTVDASGSLAMARLSESKGAVENLLAQAYARRDHVALIAFRGAEAQLLLPPTRSLVQAKRRLAAMPGGGGTPLAAGLVAATRLARQARGRGLNPALALLTDGRANVALDGAGGRAQAGADAEAVALQLRLQGIPGLVIDTSVRPDDKPRLLSDRLGARYLALPRADAERISRAVSAALDG
ncbi:magnesium chelatase subunit D [Rhodovulum sp. YNF3179]|uniref:magnesium chelatase subunit D n=1 Tax=Rhodovulum sp. YNF3179 TaxID=3425127 RepID=UPI003D3595B9